MYVSIECRNGTVNETVQLMQWMLAALCKKVMVTTATDTWEESTSGTQAHSIP